jgi:hypothetical protein
MFHLSRVKQERSGYYQPPPQKNDHNLTSVERFPGIEKRAPENRVSLKIHESAKDRELVYRISQKEGRTTQPIFTRLFLMQDEHDLVGTAVHLRPRPPTTTLAEPDDVGIAVHPDRYPQLILEVLSLACAQCATDFVGTGGFCRDGMVRAIKLTQPACNPVQPVRQSPLSGKRGCVKNPKGSKVGTSRLPCEGLT